MIFMRLKILPIGLFFLFSLIFLFPKTFSYYLDFTANTSVMPNQNITIAGTLGTSGSETISDISVTASLPNGNSSSATTSATGNFTLSVNTTGLTGYQSFSIIAGTITKTATMKITNVTSATMTITNPPPFSPGVFLVVNLTAKNSNGNVVQNQNITGKIFATDGPQPDWGTNTTVTDTKGVAFLNFSIPSTAGLNRYIIDLENGAGTAFFMLTNYMTSVLTKDSTGNTKISFAPNNVVTIEATVKSNGAPVTNKNMEFTVLDPNNIATTYATTTSSSGVAIYNYSATSVSGQYKVKINVSGEEIYSTFFVKIYSASLESESGSNFFFEFGGKSFFTPGQNVTLNIIPSSVTTGSLLLRNVNYTCNSSYFKITDTWNINGTSANSSLQTVEFIPATYNAQSICAVRFSLSAVHIGTFGMRINVTVGTSLATALTSGTTENAQGYFSIQRYGLRIEPASAFGGKEMHTLLLPGDNASFKIFAFNISSGLDLSGGNISSVTITKIRSLRTSRETNLINQTFVAATETDDPYINAVIPSYTGPQQVYVTAVVSGEMLSATTMYMGKYIMGFAQASGTRFEEGGGGDSGRGGSGQFISCTGTVQFNAMAFDAKTFMPASSVTFLNLIEARDEMTGTDISNCISITRATTDSSGRATVNITFSNSCTYSGFYFMNFNVSYRDKTDEIPGSFECKNMNFQPQTLINNQEGFNAKGDAAVTLKVSNVSYTDNATKIVTNGSVSLFRLINFNPSAGPTLLTANTNFNGDIFWDGSYYTGNITIYPQNFSLTTWPTGFFDASVQVLDSSTGSSDSATTGFASVAFETLSNWWGGCYGPPEQCGNQQNALVNQKYTAGQAISMQIYANLPAGSESDYTNVAFQAQYHNVSNIQISLISPETGDNYNVTNITWVLVNGSVSPFSSFGDNQYTWENYTLSFSLPANIRNGFYMGSIKITTNTSEKAEEPIKLEVKGLSVGYPLVGSWNGMWWWGGNLTTNYEGSVLGVSYPGCGPPGSMCTGGEFAVRNDTWGLADWTWIKNFIGFSNQSYYDITTTNVCTSNDLNISYNTGSGNGVTESHPEYNVLVFKNSTHKFIFLGNKTANRKSIYNIIPLNETNRRLPNNRTGALTTEYLWEISMCGYALFVNATTLNSTFVREEFPWAETHTVNENFYLPFAVYTGSGTPQANYNTTITDIAQLKREGFGIEGVIPRSQNNTNLWNSTSAVTDANGIAFVRLFMVNNTKFMAFWSINSTPKIGASFKSAFKFGVKAFDSYGNYVKLLPETTKRIVLQYSSECTWLKDNTSVQPPCYNGTFTENATDGFTTFDTPRTFYFVLVNDSLLDGSGASKIFKYLLIDDDPYINMTGQCGIYSDGDPSLNESKSGDSDTGCLGEGYPVKKVTINGRNRDIGYGGSIQSSAERIGFGDVWMNSTHAIINAYRASPSISWSNVQAPTQRMGARICAFDLSSRPYNATFKLDYANWMQGVQLGFTETKNITQYNLTTNTSVIYPNEITNSPYDGCYLTEVIPNGMFTISGTTYTDSWLPGRNEVLGMATPVGGGNEQEAWVGPVEYWTGGNNL
jgi:hypothetical protein